MGSRYVPVTREQIEAVLIGKCGFRHTPEDEKPGDGAELVYGRQVESREHGLFPMYVRVMSSISKNAADSRDCGEDAIRVNLYAPGVSLKKAYKESTRTIYRTKNAMTRLEEVCRGMFRLGLHLACPKCRRPMVPRTSKANQSRFYGCSGYPTCTATVPADQMEPLPE